MNRRDYLKYSAAAACTVAVSPLRAAAVNDKIRLGFIGLGGQGNGLLDRFSKHSDVVVRYLCDADIERLNATADKFPDAAKSQDLRRVIESDDIDAVVIATCNHWHCLAALWAMENGKDVYVEKPLSHNVNEGRAVVAAARRLGRIVQVGTQQRSDPMQQEMKEFLHDRAELGKVIGVEACRYGVRESIGKQAAPLTPPSTVDYNLWIGPAQDEALFRPHLHYDWHWDWNTGNGEMGNWGVHVLDDVLNVALQDGYPLPNSVQSAGGRMVWDDAGNTPNVHYARFDCDGLPVFIGLSNLPAAPDMKNKSLQRKGVSSGYIVYCEGGRFTGRRQGGAAFDADGKKIKTFRGSGGTLEHPRNFLDAVKSRDHASLNAEVALGDASANWCHLANIACRVGAAGAIDRLQATTAESRGLFSKINEQLAAFGVEFGDNRIRASQPLTIDKVTGQISGDGSDAANKLLSREYRSGFGLPELASVQ